MIGQSVGSDASPLSCFLFRPRKSREKRRKRSHTNVSSTLSTRSSTPPAQTPHVRFHRRKRVHTRLCSKNRTQRLTRRNRGLLSAVTALSCAAREIVPKEQPEKVDARLWRVSAFSGVAAPLGCVIFLQFGDVAVFSLCAQYFLNVQGWGGITTLGALYVLLKRRTAACQNGSFAVF